LPAAKIAVSAEGLGQHPVASTRKEQQIHATTLRTHPAAQVPQGVLESVEHRHEFTEKGLVTRAAAVVAVDRLQQGLAILKHEATQRAQVLHPLAVARHRLAPVRRALPLKRGLQARVDVLCIRPRAGIGRLCVHGAAPGSRLSGRLSEAR
jgi:hypothetical protein